MEAKRRLARLRELMKEKGVKALLLTDAVNVEYVSGFTGGDSYAFILPRHQYILTDGRYTEMAGKEAPDFTVLTRKPKMEKIIEKVARRHRLKVISFEGFRITYDTLKAYRKAVSSVRWKAERPLVHTLRKIKEPGEVAKVQECVRVAQAAMRVVKKKLRPGITEIDVAAELEYQMRKRGAKKPAFDTIVAAGPHSSQPHAAAGRRKFRAGDAVTIDWGANLNGYNSDLTRVFFLGRGRPGFRKIYEITLEAQRRAIEMIKPGARIAQIDAAARDYIAERGYGPQFTHSLGHGLGMEVHEAPGISNTNRSTLEPGMVFTVEPGIYIPGFGGVRVEDDVVVTKKGVKVLSGFPKKIERCIVY